MVEVDVVFGVGGDVVAVQCVVEAVRCVWVVFEFVYDGAGMDVVDV